MLIHLSGKALHIPFSLIALVFRLIFFLKLNWHEAKKCAKLHIRRTFRFNCRSSDSTKYGTNKSSGASVTSGKHLKNHTTYGAHDSVSSGKPPMHPNHHLNIHNHRTTTTTNTNTNTTITTTASCSSTSTSYTTTSTSIPVHSSNNRLLNNTVFHNNQYTFSLNRYDDSGYLESTGPLSSASLYGDGPRISRGTKSDIGVPIRRPSASATKSLLNSNSSNNFVHYNRSSSNADKPKLPSVKSDFLLSYLNNNHHHSDSPPNNQPHHGSKCQTPHNQSMQNGGQNGDHYHHPQQQQQQQQHRCSINNNSELNECTNMSSAYHISGISTSDFSENYKTGAKYFYSNVTNAPSTAHSNPNSNSMLNLNSAYSNSNSNPNKLEFNDRMDRSTNRSTHSINEQQRNRIINFVNRSHGSPRTDAGCKNSISTPSASGSYESRQTSNVVGPLLYIDPTSESPSNCSNPIMTDTQNHSFKSVSK